MVDEIVLLLRVRPGGLHLDCFASDGDEREAGDEESGRNVQKMWMQEAVRVQRIKLRCHSDCFAADGQLVRLRFILELTFSSTAATVVGQQQCRQLHTHVMMVVRYSGTNIMSP